jgi:hypothetical protein
MRTVAKMRIIKSSKFQPSVVIMNVFRLPEDVRRENAE